MERRDFLKRSCYTGLASLTGASVALGQDFTPEPRRPNESATEYAQRIARERALAAAGAPGPNEYAQRIARERTLQTATSCYTLWRYTIETPAQKDRFDAFAEAALIPALNRAELEQVRAYSSSDGLAYLLFHQRSISSMTDLSERLARDQEYRAMASAFLEPAAQSRPYQRMDAQLFIPVVSIPQTGMPVSGTGGVLRLVRYECLGVAAEAAMIGMFRKPGGVGVSVLRKAGVNPVFIGWAIAGERMPNLTCVISAEDAAAHEAASWELINHPECSARDLVEVTTTPPLEPTAYSQI